MKTLITGRRVWWQRPYMRTDADLEVERKASWLELFLGPDICCRYSRAFALCYA